MAHISSKDIVIKWETTDISEDVLAWNGFPIEVLTEEGYGYSSEWVFYESTGIKSMGDISLTVFYDTAGSGTYYTLNAALGTEGTLWVGLGAQGAGQYKEAEVIVKSVNISGDRGALVKADFVFSLASEVTEGSWT